MNAREESLRLLIESGITNDLKNYFMTNRIADVLEGVIKKRNLLEESRDSLLKREEAHLKMINDAKSCLDGTAFASTNWDDES